MVRLDIELPRFVIARHFPNKVSFYWQVPARLRFKGVVDGEQVAWPEKVMRLPDAIPEMLTRANQLNAELDRLRKVGFAENRHGSMPWLIENFEHSTSWAELKPKTQRSYKQLAGYVLKWSKTKNHPLVKSLTTPKVLQFLSDFDTRRSLRNHIAAYLRLLLRHGIRIGELQTNVADRLGLKKAKRKKKIRTIDVPELLQLVAKADEMGLSFVGTGALLHFDLGQRQGDVLSFQRRPTSTEAVPNTYWGGVFNVTQSKTDKPLTLVPFLPETKARLEAQPHAQLMLVAGADGLAVKEDHYRKMFRKVAKAAGFHDLWEMELRHSCVIFMERAGLTPSEIATRTGHTLKSVLTILEEYRYRDSVVAHQGAVKLADYRNKVKS